LIDSCGDSLKFRYVTYDRHVVTKAKPVTGALGVPVLTSPPDGTIFEHVPRDLLLTWGSVPGATSYGLELDCRGCCQPRKELFCAEQENGSVFITQPHLTTPAFYTLWNGPHNGRWRVRALKSEGGQEKASPWSAWTAFRFAN